MQHSFVAVIFWGFTLEPARMYDHVVIERLPQTRHTKAPSALHKATKQVRADQSATTQARRQSWQELMYRRAFMQLAAFLKRTRIRNRPGGNIQPLT